MAKPSRIAYNPATMNKRWRIELLGTPRVYRDGGEVMPLQNPKTDALLAYLAFYQQRPHSREELTELFWPEVDPATGRNRLSLALARLRQRLGIDTETFTTLLIADKVRIALNRETVDTDTAAFESALDTARTATTIPARIAAFTTAIQRYNGELLPGFYNDWALRERDRLTESFLAAQLILARLLREQGSASDLAAAEGYTRAALTQSPEHEEAHLELARVLDTSGRRAEALRQLQELKRVLEDIAVPLSPEAVALETQLRTTPAPSRALSPTTIRFKWTPPPATLTRFFGRQTERARIESYIGDGVRVITLLGAGGSGKTRLATETARLLSERFGGAVAWVPLAGIADTRRVPDSIAEALRLDRSTGNDIIARIVERLSTVPAALLVLDNLEHLLTPSARAELPLLLRHLLEELPGLTLLMTSRQRVGIEGEHEVTVAPLPLPAVTESVPRSLEQASSVQLFIDRAQAVLPGFELTTANAATVATLCAQLEGIPLAIELCAAWAQTLTPAQMLARLNDRFALLVSQRTDGPERHRTITAALAYSYDLLPDELRTAFLHLSVFRGGWTIEAAFGIGIDLQTLTALRERSLIVTESDITAGMRFAMLETLREFAAGRQTPEEKTDLRRTHADYFIDFAEIVRPHLTGAEQATYFDQLQAEHDNLRAVLDWCLETGDAARGVRLAIALHIFWNIRGYLGEGRDWLDRLEALSEFEQLSPALYASALRTQSRIYHWLGENDRAAATAREALHISTEAGDEKGIAGAWVGLGNAAQFTGDSQSAREAYQRALDIARRIGDESLIASTLNNLGLTENAAQNWEAAHAYYAEALVIFRRIGHRNYQATALGNMAVSKIYQNDLDAAFPYLTEALAIHRALGSNGDNALVNLAVICRRRGDYAGARSFLTEAFTKGRITDRKYLLAAAIREMGHLDVAEEHFERGAFLLGAAAALCESLHISFALPEAAELERSRNRMHAAIGETRTEVAWQTGRHAPVPQVIATALNQYIV